MRDPVADVLAERSATGNGLAGAIALSFVLHAVAAALAIMTALRHAPPQPIRTVNIRLAQATAPAQVPVSAPSTAAPPAPALPRIQEPAPQPVKPPPAKKAAEPPAKNTAPMSPFGRSTKKGSETPPPPPPPSPPASREATSTMGGAVGVGQAGVTALEGGDFPYTLYLDRMQRQIGTRWVRPEVGTGATAVVYFRIDRDGTIRDARITTGSGNGMFDRAALRAILEASPLPALPFDYNGHYLGVHLTFR